MSFQYNNAPVVMKFSRNVVPRVLEAVAICLLIWYAKKNAFPDVIVLMVKSWTTQEDVLQQRNVHASLKKKLSNLVKVWMLQNAQLGKYI